MNIAIIKAGGIGSRMNAGIPKQFVCVDEKPIIIYTIEAFERHPDIDEILVVCVEGWHDVLKSYFKKFHITKVINVINGGTTSLRSIKCGLDALIENHSRNDIVLIHDANRPLVSSEIISSVLVESKLYGNAVASIQCTDEIMKSSVGTNESNQFLNRKEIYRIQTPDAYNLGEIYDIISNASEEELEMIGATNTLWISHGGTMHLAEGSEVNIRLTKQEDILLFEALLKTRNKKNDVGKN